MFIRAAMVIVMGGRVCIVLHGQIFETSFYGKDVFLLSTNKRW